MYLYLQEFADENKTDGIKVEQKYDEEEKVNADNTENINSNFDDIYIWKKNEKYIQSELDMIHAYFVHHEWQNDMRCEQSAEKYITNIPDSPSIDQYKFGVDHDYQHLKSKYKCLRD
eukprot:551176_1